MKIAIVAAGRVGNLVIDEAVSRGHQVTAFVKKGDKVSNSKANVIEKDLFDLVSSDLNKFDAVVDSFGVWDENQELHITTLRHLSNILANSDVRLLIVGGAGSLYVNTEQTIQVMHTEGFPEVFLPLASNMSKALDELRTRNDVKWTYVSPAADFQFEGKKSGNYILAGENFTLNDKGISEISYADYAIAMVDEIEKGTNIQKRISVLAK